MLFILLGVVLIHHVAPGATADAVTHSPRAPRRLSGSAPERLGAFSQMSERLPDDVKLGLTYAPACSRPPTFSSSLSPNCLSVFH